MRLTRAQNVLRLAGNVQNRVDFWGSAPDPPEGAYDAPSDSLVVKGFFSFSNRTIAASRLWRLQFPGLRRALVGGIASTTQGGIDATDLRPIWYAGWPSNKFRANGGRGLYQLGEHTCRIFYPNASRYRPIYSLNLL